MNNITRYVVKLQNGQYMKQEFDCSKKGIYVKSSGIDHPIDASLFKSKDIAERVIVETINGNSNLFVKYDKNNPPKIVEQLNINLHLA